MRRALQALVLALVGCVCGVASAQSPVAIRSPISLDAAQVLGSGTPTNPGWFSCSLRVTNTGSEPVAGTVKLVSRLAWSHDSGEVVTRAPFAAAGGESVTLQLPTHGYYVSAPQLRAEAYDDSGQELAAVDLADPRSVDPMLFSLAVPFRATPWLRGQRVLVGREHPTRGSYDLPVLEVSVPQVRAASGELVLPERASGYGSSTLVLAPSIALSRLNDDRRQAIADWVLGGGSLAVVISRPEDLRVPLLEALVGGPLETTDPPAQLLAPRAFIVAPEQTGDTSPIRKTAEPLAEVAETFVGYRGGNLRPTPWGAAASYGLGEVHVLGFDPNVEAVAGDPWVHLQLLDLVRYAWDRKIYVALPHGETALDSGAGTVIRRLLDPNEGTRWAIPVAALVLLLYSVIAGPVSFHRAARAQRPLRALLQLPIWSLLTLFVIVGLGILAKGLTGEARHITLVEAGSGMDRAAVTRFRAFYSPTSSELTVGTAERGNVLDVAGPTQDTGRVLVVDRDGARLERFRAEPWQTVLVREDGFTRFGKGISLTPDGDDVRIKNRSGRDLVGVLVRRPDGDALLFDRITDGESVAASQGDRVRRLPTTGGLGLGSLAERLDEIEPQLGETWNALEASCHHETRWWPEGVPALIAQLAGGEGAVRDSGLRLREDRVLVRVVGFGGVP